MIFVDRKGNLHDTMRYPEYCGCETCGICGLMNKGEEFARFLHLRTATLKHMFPAAQAPVVKYGDPGSHGHLPGETLW